MRLHQICLLPGKQDGSITGTATTIAFLQGSLTGLRRSLGDLAVAKRHWTQ
jgi:hypothetical protein